MSVEKLNIEPFMPIIESHAHVAMRHLRKPTSYTIDDLISEGILVFYKDFLKCYKPGGAAAASTLLQTCLRNHHCGMQYKSWRQNVIDAEVSYTRNHVNRSTLNDPAIDATINIMLEEFIERLDEKELEYLYAVLKYKTRRVIKKNCGISLNAQRRMKKSIMEKMKEVM